MVIGYRDIKIGNEKIVWKSKIQKRYFLGWVLWFLGGEKHFLSSQFQLIVWQRWDFLIF
jgi:hypothetical protein